jgi:predicted ribosomally synthesized peptide with nif11-like leader
MKIYLKIGKEGDFMATKNVLNFFAVVKEDKSLQRKIKLATNLNTIIEIAAGYDYQFTSKELQSFLEKIPNQDLAPAINPGVGNRLHLIPR